MIVYISVTKRQLSFEFEYVIVSLAIVSVLLLHTIVDRSACWIDACMCNKLLMMLFLMYCDL